MMAYSWRLCHVSMTGTGTVMDVAYVGYPHLLLAVHVHDDQVGDESPGRGDTAVHSGVSGRGVQEESFNARYLGDARPVQDWRGDQESGGGVEMTCQTSLVSVLSRLSSS
jgi:hypothetical protein